MEGDRLYNDVTIIGQIIPREHDSKMFSIGIMTDQGPCAIKFNSASEGILDLLYKDVRATGILNKLRDGTLQIMVNKYEVLE